MNARAWTVLVVGVLVLTGAFGWLANGLKERRRAQLFGGGPRDTPELRREREENRREAAAVFNAPVEPSGEEAGEFARVLARFSDAVRDRDADAMTGLFAPDRVLDEVARQAGGGVPVASDPGFRAGFTSGFRAGAQGIVSNPLFRWDSTAVRRVRWAADGSEAVVVAAHRRRAEVGGEPVQLTIKARWWFVRRGGAWRVYDFEDLDGGVRLTAGMAALFAPAFRDRLPQIQGAVAGLRDAQAALLDGDLDAVEAGLARVRTADLPAALDAVVTFLEAAARLGRGDPDGALKALDRAGELNPDMPGRHALRAAALNATGDHAGALAAADLYVSQLGPDADVDVHRGVALSWLNRAEEAAAAFRRALDDDPDSKDALNGLRSVLPDGGKAELADRLARAPSAGRVFDDLVRAARADNDEEAVKALERGLRKALPADPRGVSAAVRRLVEAKSYPEAAAELKAGLGAVAAADRRQVLVAYLYAMIAADRPLDAYAAVPAADAAAAFRTLAGELDDSLEEFDPADPPPAAAQLRELIAAHRKRAPKDAWLGFYEAALLQYEGQYEKAERGFAAAEAAYRKAPAPPPAGGKDWEADQFRFRRVRCLYQAKQGLKAYAEVGPAADTFEQLAHAYENDNDAAGLGALVAAHRKRSPDDATLGYWAAALAYLEADYGRAADGFAAFLKAAGEKEPRRWSATDRCVRGYLRAGKPAKARAAVAEIGADRVGPGLRVAVTLADGKEAEADELLAELAKDPRGGFGFVYYDEDFARLVARPEFAALRKKYPDPRPAKPAGPVG
ncbi:MAG: hypothetical protein C0501_05405 [Isosphaera sp.]|nr:hypothetical protein [Isosphaera sp.]